MAVDAIVTEPPYGRATTLNGESLESLIERSFTSFNEVLKPKGRIVISLPNEKHAGLGDQYFKIIRSFKLRIHRSLTKNLVIYEKKNEII
jgi:tRNA (guanine10-N2)-dimethyltransferase